jgi:hypothetical protein
MRNEVQNKEVSNIIHAKDIYKKTSGDVYFEPPFPNLIENRQGVSKINIRTDANFILVMRSFY